ncbi:hypothetical protein CLOM_g198 [Closterium sp. NIES-68]|nr:hypothetical protein CLOM_g198 [Closterium sp. NIES-68]GJP68045.1 hypothetical protein CLOP_g24800 [Closterium sp. NIES-67]
MGSCFSKQKSSKQRPPDAPNGPPANADSTQTAPAAVLAKPAGTDEPKATGPSSTGEGASEGASGLGGTAAGDAGGAGGAGAAAGAATAAGSDTSANRPAAAAAAGKVGDSNAGDSNAVDGAALQFAKYDKNDTSIPLGLRTDFGYKRDFEAHYKLGKELGHGQFGTTYESIQLATGERVAAKAIEKKQMKLPIAVEDVRREVAIMKLLSGHPNVVQFIDVFEDTDFVFICMEICEGGELLDRILSKRENRYSEKDAAGVVRQMLSVVAKCHLHGVVHRDLKPENFLFKSKAEDSLLKATDFGLSDFRKPGKHFTDVVGSAYYVAPEVLKRRSGPESDVWSIGVITYILLSGRRPFWDRTEAGIFNEVLKKRPDFREKPWPNVSSSAKDFVKKLLKKDPRARPTAAQALSHKWVKEGGDASSVPLDIAVLSNMREFVKYSRLKQMALKALATTLEESEVQSLRDQFNAMDINKDGTITIDEIRQALSHDLPFEVKESRVLQILQAMDTNCDGIIDFDEFVAATLHVQQLEEADSTKWQERSRAAFAQFDRDNDGYIDAEELRMAAQVNFPLDNLIAEADTDGDGRISLPEFQKLLRCASINSRTNTSRSRGRSWLGQTIDE